MATFLQTDRLILRNLSPDDLDTLYLYRNNADCARYQHWENTSREYLKDFIQKFHQCVFLSKEPEQHYAICLTDNQLIGDLSCFYNEHDPCFTLGYTISYQFQRQGYAFEMLSKVLCAIEKQYPGMDIVGLVEKENVPSISLLKKTWIYRRRLLRQNKLLYLCEKYHSLSEEGLIKQHISKIIFAISRLCFVFTVALRIHEILGGILFNLNQPETYVMLFLCLFGFILLALYRIIDLMESK